MVIRFGSRAGLDEFLLCFPSVRPARLWLGIASICCPAVLNFSGSVGGIDFSSFKYHVNGPHSAEGRRRKGGPAHWRWWWWYSLARSALLCVFREITFGTFSPSPAALMVVALSRFAGRQRRRRFRDPSRLTLIGAAAASPVRRWTCPSCKMHRAKGSPDHKMGRPSGRENALWEYGHGKEFYISLDSTGRRRKKTEDDDAADRAASFPR